MRLGMYIDLRNPPEWHRPWDRFYGRWLERTQEAERLGASSVWLSEHHFFADGYLPQCWTFAAAIAARTTTLRIGTGICILPLHDPLELAEQIAVADVISGGRIEPGFGLGYRKPEYLAFQGNFKRRYGEYAERVNALRAYWGEQPGPGQLSTGQLSTGRLSTGQPGPGRLGPGRTVTPAPLQRPVPMWGGFNGPQGAALAGRLGLSLQSLKPELLEPYQKGRQAGGHDPRGARMGGHLQYFLADDPDQAWERVKPHLVYRWRTYNRYMYEGTRLESAAPDYYNTDDLRAQILIGTPPQVAAAIRDRLAGLPVTDLMFWADFPGLADDLVDRHIELSLTRLAPLLADDPADEPAAQPTDEPAGQSADESAGQPADESAAQPVGQRGAAAHG